MIQPQSKRGCFRGEVGSLHVMNDLCRDSPPSLLSFLLGYAALAGWLHLPSLMCFVPLLLNMEAVCSGY